MNKYIDLINIPTNYAKRMSRLSRRIFGEVARPTTNKSLRVVRLLSARPTDKNPEIINYYPRLRETHELMKNLRMYGLFRDEHEDFKEEYERLRELRGKMPWKKGQKKKEIVKVLK